MSPVPEPLTLPSEWQILLNGQQDTEGKIDRLLPLLELLNIPEGESTTLGEALLEALTLIAGEARQIRAQREQEQGLIGELRVLISGQEERVQDMGRKIDEMHALLTGPRPKGPAT